MTFIDTVTDTFYRPTAEPGVAHVSIRDPRHNAVLDLDGRLAGRGGRGGSLAARHRASFREHPIA